jgi:hypothetical protein
VSSISHISPPFGVLHASSGLSRIQLEECRTAPEVFGCWMKNAASDQNGFVERVAGVLEVVTSGMPIFQKEQRKRREEVQGQVQDGVAYVWRGQ